MQEADAAKTVFYKATAADRGMELLSIGAWLGLSVSVCVRLVAFSDSGWWVIVLAAAAGMIASDFCSGLAHWAADTWGDADTPFLGHHFIQPFREHHVDQMAITRHDFVETNGNNCLVSLPVLLLALLIPIGVQDKLGLFAVSFTLFVALWIMATNQIHQWAHSETPPWFILLAQRLGVILRPEHHALHHSMPYAVNYCITTGWLNGLLTRTRFFPVLERIITRLTGALPRQDDLNLPPAPVVPESSISATASSILPLTEPLPE